MPPNNEVEIPLKAQEDFKLDNVITTQPEKPVDKVMDDKQESSPLKLDDLDCITCVMLCCDVIQQWWIGCISCVACCDAGCCVECLNGMTEGLGECMQGCGECCLHCADCC